MKFIDIKIKLHKIRHWEYWHTRTIYLPLSFVWLFFSLRNKSIYFFNYANPSIKYGGLVMCSKKEIYDLIPNQWIPKTLKFAVDDPFEKIKDSIHRMNLSFPMVIKPDIGLKGLGVHFIEDLSQLKSEISKAKEDFLLQEKIPYRNEVGIFYVRYPNELSGRCTGMVRKDFLKVVGDGNATLGELINSDSRAFIHYKQLFELWKKDWNTIVEKGEKITLVPFGSHTRGASFYDVSEFLTPQLCSVIDSICTKVDGFYYGRLDIMFKDWNNLLLGKEISVIEINGAAAEPTHIYDPKHSYFFASKTIVKHWMMMSKISRINKKILGKHNYSSTTKAIKENLQLERRLRRSHGL